MEGRVKKDDNPINRVKCVVNTCHYYGMGDHCTAEHIEIQSPNSWDSQTTDCATFVPENK